MLELVKFLGVRADGRPFWPYLGGSEGAAEDGGAGDGGDDDDGDDEGDEGGAQKAIQAERARAKAARDAARPWRQLAQELGVKNADEVRALLAAAKKTDNGSGEEKIDVEAVKRAVREEERGKTRRQIVGAAVEALAATSFADPEDAAKYLDLADYEVDDDGQVDRKRIKTDLADVLARKPHLKKVSSRVDHEQGPRGKGPSNGADMSDLIRQAAGRGRR
jgi:hypothetical protein